jgi:hypothetical protein
MYPTIAFVSMFVTSIREGLEPTCSPLYFVFITKKICFFNSLLIFFFKCHFKNSTFSSVLLEEVPPQSQLIGKLLFANFADLVVLVNLHQVTFFLRLDVNVKNFFFPRHSRSEIA